jgi:hypothetical protein
MDHGLASRGSVKSLALRIYLPSALCFFVICITNSTLLSAIARHGLVYGADASLAVDLEKTARFFVVPVKALIFFVCTAVVFEPLFHACREIFRRIRSNPNSYKTVISLSVCLILTTTIFPWSYGRSYARISTEPFSQEVDQTYRRLLLPGLAYLWHLDGFLYTFLFWAIVLVAALTVRSYFLSHGIDLSILQEISFLTVGIFATSFQSPGYPEIAVFLLALISIIAFEADGHFSEKQLAAFSLALMAHESAAVIIFAPVILILFRSKSWIPNAIMLLLYGIAVMANFSFDLAAPIHTQSMVSGHPAPYYLWQSPSTDLLAVLLSFKLLWVLIFVALFYLVRSRPRMACFIFFAIALAISSTYIATDYSRLIAFATLPLIFSFVEAHKRLSSRTFNLIAALNILTPSFAAYGFGGLITSRGLYYLIFRTFMSLPAPVH